MYNLIKDTIGGDYMYCTRCGNSLLTNTRECSKCGYVLTSDEFEEGKELDKKNSKKQSHKKPRTHKEKVVRNNPNEVIIIKDNSRDTNKYVSNSRFLGYFLLITFDFSLLIGIWYLVNKLDLNSIMLGSTFIVLSIAFLIFGLYVVKQSGVNKKFLKEKSMIFSILGLITCLISFILLLVEMSNNNLLLIFISIGLFMVGFVSFIVGIGVKEDNKHIK